MSIVAEKPVTRLPEETPGRLLRLQRYVEREDFIGHGLFDSLNSRLFKATPLAGNRLARLCLTQFGKRSPVNFRPLLMTPKSFNAKGGGLFLMGYLNLLGIEDSAENRAQAHALYRRLLSHRIPRETGGGWGYPHDWQARAFNVPEGTPNLVSSVYVGRAMLAYYRRFDAPEALEGALGVARFLLGEMIKFETDEHLCFRYIPGKDAEVHNASLHGASYLSQVAPFFPDTRGIRDKILKAVRFSAADMNADGSWPYGTQAFHRWVDNFHTAYNIECLIRIGHYLRTDEFMPILEQAIDYYLSHLFTGDGTPRNLSTHTYPIDVHTLAQAILHLNELDTIAYPHHPARRRQIADRLERLMDEFQDPVSGHFYYQKMQLFGRFPCWNKIPYMRWGQAWMFFALSTSLAGNKATGLLD